MSCQTSHQLNHYCAEHSQVTQVTKSPFDWLICPPESAANWLAEGLRDFNCNDITEHKDHAYWSYFRLWFWHGFIDRSGENPILDLSGMTDQELAKLNYLRLKFRALDLSQTHFIVSNTQNNLNTEVFEADEESQYLFTENGVARLESALETFFDKPVNMHVVTRAGRATPGLLKRSNVHSLPRDNSNWKGDKVAWYNLLSRLSLRLTTQPLI